MIGAIREIKRRVQMPSTKVSYCPNLFKATIKVKHPTEHDESDDLELLKEKTSYKSTK